MGDIVGKENIVYVDIAAVRYGYGVSQRFAFDGKIFVHALDHGELGGNDVIRKSVRVFFVSDVASCGVVHNVLELGCVGYGRHGHRIGDLRMLDNKNGV